MSAFGFATTIAFVCGMAVGGMKSWKHWLPFTAVTGLAIGALGRFWGLA